MAEHGNNIIIDKMLEALDADVRGDLKIPEETCNTCPRSFCCYTTPFASDYQSILAQCHRPRGLARRPDVIPFVKYQYLWATPYIPVQVKLNVLKRRVLAMETKLKMQYGLTWNDLQNTHLSDIAIAVVVAIKLFHTGIKNWRVVNRNLATDTANIKKTIEELNLAAERLSQRIAHANTAEDLFSLGHATAACCFWLPAVIGSRGQRRWENYVRFYAECLNAVPQEQEKVDMQIRELLNEEGL